MPSIATVIGPSGKAQGKPRANPKQVEAVVWLRWRWRPVGCARDATLLSAVIFNGHEALGG